MSSRAQLYSSEDIRAIFNIAGFVDYATAKAAAGNSRALLAPPVVNADVAGAKTRYGLTTGHICVGQSGDYRTDTNAFVGIIADELYVNPEQEMRGISYTVRQYRTTPDEATLGWDIFGVAGNIVVEAANTQFIRGNMKAVVGEMYFRSPLTGSYTVLTAHNFQAFVEVDTNVTVTNWYGAVVSTPAGAGTITNAFGIYIRNLAGTVALTNPAAVKIDGSGVYGQIKWGACSITEDSSGKLQFDLNSKQLVLLGALTGTTATAGGATLPANPSGFLRVLIGGTERRIPYYEP